LPHLRALKAAIDAAAAAGVNFNFTVQQANKLNDQLLHGAINAKDYQTSIRALAKDLADLAARSQEARLQSPRTRAIPSPTSRNAVIGAEGTGQNPQSSAFRIWASSWRRSLGDPTQQSGRPTSSSFTLEQAAGMTAAEIDALRNRRPIAEAIIEAATKDYVKVLKAAGQQITAAGLYTVHVLGSGDAKKLFAASPNQSVRSALGGGAHADAVVSWQRKYSSRARLHRLRPNLPSASGIVLARFPVAQSLDRRTLRSRNLRKSARSTSGSSTTSSRLLPRSSKRARSRVCRLRTSPRSSTMRSSRAARSSRATSSPSRRPANIPGTKPPFASRSTTNWRSCATRRSSGVRLRLNMPSANARSRTLPVSFPAWKLHRASC
jgi:hypothetical protein